MQELKLPELGESIEAVDVTAVLVAVGDRVARDQPLVEVETEKASLEVPSEHEGVVKEVLVSAGDSVKVGQVLLRIESEAGADKPVEDAPSEEPPRKAPSETPREAPAPAPVKEPVPTAPPPPVEPPPPPPEPARSAAAAATAPAVIDFPTPATALARVAGTVAASPSTRRLAREIGVDIRQVKGSGPGGRISRDDVKEHAKSLIGGGAGAAGVPLPAGTPATPEMPDFAKWGPTETEPLSNVRRATARQMTASWTAPHVTQFDRADVTDLEALRKRFNERPDRAAKLTMTALIVKAVAGVLSGFPKFNASLDLAGDRIVYKKYIHVGVAVETERGLLVPVIRDANVKGLVEIAGDLDDLATRARDRKLRPDEMAGASFTVTNLGGLGTTYFSPIVSWPESSILGIGRASREPVWQGETFGPRLVMPLSVSYDHRLIDGADCARFMRRLAETLEQPLLMLG